MRKNKIVLLSFVLCFLTNLMFVSCDLADDDRKYEQLVINSSSFTLYANECEIPVGKNICILSELNTAGRALPLVFSDNYGPYPRINVYTEWVAIPIKEKYTITDSNSKECSMTNTSSARIYVYNNYFGSFYSDENRCAVIESGETLKKQLYNDNTNFSCMYENGAEAHCSIMEDENGYKVSVY